MSILAFPPGLLRSPPIDPKTGLWSRPWLEYWQAAFERLGGTEAPTNTELDAMLTASAMEFIGSPSADARLGALAQQVEHLTRTLAAQPKPHAAMAALEYRCADLERAVVAIQGVYAQLQALAGLVEAVRRAAPDGVTAHLARLEQRLETVERQTVYR